MTDNGYAIGELAALAKVTVRTLHYYDEIGLQRPNRCRPSPVQQGRP